MAWVRFLEPFSFTPPRERRVTIDYRHDGPTAGEYSVTTTCARQAVEKGAAERIKPPRRPS